MALLPIKIAISVILINFATVIFATDYCDPKLCSGNHIACGNSLVFSRNCRNPKNILLTNKLKQYIVDLHNENRNYIAGGRTDVPELRAACRMATMQWDDELAYLAELNVRKCRMEHDCHNTDAFRYSGQNLAFVGYYDTPDLVKLTQSSIDMWFDERRKTRMSQIRSFPVNHLGPQIGHFTVMMADRNIRVGCAASTYNSAGRFKSFLFACNYATTNMIDFPIYKDCNVAASACTSGRNPFYNNLCSISESYNVNSWY